MNIELPTDESRLSQLRRESTIRLADIVEAHGATDVRLCYDPVDDFVMLTFGWGGATTYEVRSYKIITMSKVGDPNPNNRTYFTSEHEFEEFMDRVFKEV